MCVTMWSINSNTPGLPAAERVDLLRIDLQQVEEERDGGHEEVSSAEVLRLRGTFKHEHNQPPF